jgi:D-alanyl-D-alanine carboxypeptidase/D-alanyl-D-alanine-endopeptidase (penicillin-binding protein 4)
VLAALVLLGLFSANSVGAPPLDASSKLRRCLAKRAGSRRFATWGVVVKELPSGKVLYVRNPRLPFNPASNIKLVTSAAALKLLGPRFRFSTEVFGRVDRRGRAVEGGLYLRGGGDPSLTTVHLAELVRVLQSRGVELIRGPLYLDVSAYKGRFDPPGFRRFRSSHPFRAGVGALSLNHNVVRVAITPGEAQGDRARVTVGPASTYVTVLNRTRTTGWRTRLRVSTHQRPGATQVKVTGRINIRSRPRFFWRRVFNPPLYAGHTFLTLLRQAGIRVANPRVAFRRLPEGTPRLAISLSDELAEIVHAGTKYSSNVVAEHLLLALGADRYGRPATFEKGQRVLADYLKRFGVKPGEYRVENGSGLSRRSRIRPADLMRVLEGIHRDFGARPELMAALPLAGVDGTLRRRFKGSRARGLVRAKTGTLSGVSCLSGFVGGINKRVLLFTFMAGRVRRTPVVLWQQTAMAGCLVDYLRVASPSP